MLEKSEVSKLLREFIALSERQFGKSVKAIRTDNGTEFMVLTPFFKQQGIEHHTSCVDTPQQNGRVERKHRHILNVARACLLQARLPVSFWGESILTATHLINRTPSQLLQGRTPYELLYGKKPDFDKLRVFGCLCYSHRKSRDKDKFGDRSRKCLFVGYPYGKKAWRLYDLDTHEFFESRDVVFSETKFPGVDDNEYVTPKLNALDPTIDDWLLPTLATRGSTLSPTSATPVTGPATTSLSVPIPEPSVPLTTTSGSSATDHNALETSAENIPSSPPSVPAVSPEAMQSTSPGIPEILGRGQRIKTPSVILKDYVTHSATLHPPHSHSHSKSNHGSPLTVIGNIPYPISSYISDHLFSESHKVFMAALINDDVPKNFKEAVKHKIWTDAMHTEVDAFEANDTWDVTQLPPGKTALRNQWLYSYKYKADGSIERPKARLVVCGNNHVEGEDFTDTFAPVAKMSTVRIILKIAATKNWLVDQMDVSNAFLHGDLDEEIYMRLPPGFKASDPRMVCRLKKSLYGLRQAPRCWYSKLTTTLEEFGFSHDYADHSLFSKVRGSVCLHILVYVDDFIISCNDAKAMQEFKDYLQRCFRMKDLGKLKYFLGFEVGRNASGFYLSQRKYALDIISETGLLGARPSLVPMELNHQLARAEGPLANALQYRRLIGRLIYLTNTRPDLGYSIHILAQFMQKPLLPHWEAALRVVRYLKGTAGQGIFLKADDSLEVSIYCDADWGACPVSRRSLSAYITFLGSTPVTWQTKKQDTVSLSSEESEYRAMSVAVKELKWFKELFDSFGLPPSLPMKLFCDSKSAIYIAANPVFHERTKHVERDCHHVRDAIKSKLITTEHVTSKNQLADILTKPLPRPQFDDILSKLSVRNLTLPT